MKLLRGKSIKWGSRMISNFSEYSAKSYEISSNILINQDMVCLVSSVLSSLLRRDMSLNRRLFSWILGSEINPDLLPGKHRSEVEIVFSPGFLDQRSILICFQVNTGASQRSSSHGFLTQRSIPTYLQVNTGEVVFFPGFLNQKSTQSRDLLPGY